MTYPEIMLGLIFAAGLAGLARGFSGFGAALIFIPLSSIFVEPRVGAPLLVLIDLVFSIPLVVKAWSGTPIRPILLMLVGAVCTIPIGTWLLKFGDPDQLRWTIVSIGAAMLVLMISGWRYKGSPNSAMTILVGAISGIFTGIAQLGGPPVVAYWLTGKGSAATARANIILFIAGSTVISLFNYLAGYLYSLQIFEFGVFCGPAYGAGMIFGSRMFGLASDKIFRLVCLVLIALSIVVSLPIWR